MRELTSGHRYALDHFEGAGCEIVQFIHKEADPTSSESPHALRTVQDGTTNEEVLRMMIARMQFLHRKLPCRESEIVITKLEEALMWLEKRTSGRVQRGVEGTFAP